MTPEQALTEAWAYIDETVLTVADAAEIAETSEVLLKHALESGALASLRTCDVMLYRDRREMPPT